MFDLNVVHRFQKQRGKDGPLDYLTYALPATRWLRNYSFKQNLLVCSHKKFPCRHLLCTPPV